MQIKKICLLVSLSVAFPILSSCTTTAPVAGVSQSDEEYVKRREITENGQLLHSEKPSRKAIERAKKMGLRTDGYYWWNAKGYLPSKSEQSDKNQLDHQSYIRFCDDGSVVGAVTTGVPSQVKRWLTCNPVSPKYSHGVLRLSGKRISFTMHAWTGEVDYWGRVPRKSDIQDHHLELQLRSRIQSAKTYLKKQRENYMFFPLDLSE